ncbi:MAG: outer membrane protein transport protein [Gemmatimonadales bacterium]|jgi:long-chain fatty acid transport protein
MRRIAVLCAATLSAAIILAPSARAQGFSVYEHDPCTMARGGAGVAAPCAGGSAVFFNPAGILAAGKRFNLEFNSTFIQPKGNFVDSASRVRTDLVNATYYVPSGYATYQLSPKAAVGFGAFAPYGLTTEWPSSFQGRFMAYKTVLKSIYWQPTFAYQVAPGFQVGVGADYVTASAQVHRRVDLSTVTVPGQAFPFALLGVPVGTDFADALFDVTGHGWGGHIGVMWQASSKLSFGIRYQTQVKVNFTGTASFTQIATGITLPAGNPLGLPGGTPLDALLTPNFAADSLLGSQSASTSITMPDQLVVGLAYKLTPRFTVMADYQFTGWSKFSSLDLTLAKAPAVSMYENYGNTSAFRAGFEWNPTGALEVRAGVLTHNGASPAETVTPVLPEGQRIEGTVGLGIPLSDWLRLDVAYQYLQQAERHGRMVDAPVPTTALNSGLFHFTGNLFGASLALAF